MIPTLTETWSTALKIIKMLSRKYVYYVKSAIELNLMLKFEKKQFSK